MNQRITFGHTYVEAPRSSELVEKLLREQDFSVTVTIENEQRFRDSAAMAIISLYGQLYGIKRPEGVLVAAPEPQRLGDVIRDLKDSGTVTFVWETSLGVASLMIRVQEDEFPLEVIPPFVVFMKPAT